MGPFPVRMYSDPERLRRICEGGEEDRQDRETSSSWKVSIFQATDYLPGILENI